MLPQPSPSWLSTGLSERQPLCSYHFDDGWYPETAAGVLGCVYQSRFDGSRVGSLAVGRAA